jgi:transcriptional regulator with XRE-family HTH domain
MTLDAKKVNWDAFGDLMHGRRAERRLSQSEVARELGISQPAGSLIERGSPIGLTDDRLSVLMTLLAIAENEVPTAEPPKPAAGRRLFISYSHKDKDYLARLMIHIRPLEKNGLIDSWNDTALLQVLSGRKK